MKHQVSIWCDSYKVVNLTVVVESTYEAVCFMERLVINLNKDAKRGRDGFWKHWSGMVK